LVVSLEEMQKLPTPTNNDVQAYRTYLENRQILVEDETQFLRAPDLVALSQGPRTNALERDQSTPAPLVPLRTLISGFSMSGLCLAVLLMVLPDIMTRLVMVLCYLVLIATVLSTTGHLRRLKQLFEG
jgi:Flp pilus assembly protein TadB